MNDPRENVYTPEEMQERINGLEEAIENLSSENGELMDALNRVHLHNPVNPLDDMFGKMMDMYADMVPRMFDFYKGYSFHFTLNNLQVNPEADSVGIGELSFDIVAPKSETSTEVSVD